MNKEDKEYLDSMESWTKEKELVIEEDGMRIGYLKKVIANYKKQIQAIRSTVECSKIMLQVGYKDIERVKDRDKK